MSDKYGEALGIWNLQVGGANLELKPQKGDNRKFRSIIMKEEYKKNKSLLMDSFEEFMLKVIQRDYPPVDDEERSKQEEYVEFNVSTLFEEVMVAFRWTTREELEKQKKEALKDLKKLTEGS